MNHTVSMATLVLLLLALCFAPAVLALVNCTQSNFILSQARYDLAAAAACNRIYFAGGQNGTGYPDAVDVYNTITKNFDPPLVLPHPRPFLAAAATKTKVLFIGGDFSGSSAVDVLDCSTNTWTALTIPYVQKLVRLKISLFD